MPKTHRITLPQPLHAAGLRGEVSMLLVRMKPQPTVYDAVAFKLDICTYAPYAPGDLIACREPWRRLILGERGSDQKYSEVFAYEAGITSLQPSGIMPLAACRLWYRVVSVSACRVADVTEEEARAMGYPRIATRAGSLHRAGMKLAYERAGWGRQDWAWKLNVERKNQDQTSDQG